MITKCYSNCPLFGTDYVYLLLRTVNLQIRKVITGKQNKNKIKTHFLRSWRMVLIFHLILYFPSLLTLTKRFHNCTNLQYSCSLNIDLWKIFKFQDRLRKVLFTYTILFRTLILLLSLFATKDIAFAIVSYTLQVLPIIAWKLFQFLHPILAFRNVLPVLALRNCQFLHRGSDTNSCTLDVFQILASRKCCLSRREFLVFTHISRKFSCSCNKELFPVLASKKCFCSFTNEGFHIIQ